MYNIYLYAKNFSLNQDTQALHHFKEITNTQVNRIKNMLKLFYIFPDPHTKPFQISIQNSIESLISLKANSHSDEYTEEIELFIVDDSFQDDILSILSKISTLPQDLSTSDKTLQKYYDIVLDSIMELISYTGLEKRMYIKFFDCAYTKKTSTRLKITETIYSTITLNPEEIENLFEDGLENIIFEYLNNGNYDIKYNILLILSEI
mmetsp:Transcript_27836/g.24634  ORF Transcript_27836/g.24634 Transcript_27836/m.24634 type:complete len:206 (-) Transcript_27836:315-932(-)